MHVLQFQWERKLYENAFFQIETTVPTLSNTSLDVSLNNAQYFKDELFHFLLLKLWWTI